MTTIINASRLLWPISHPDHKFGRYGCTILADDVPARLADHIVPKRLTARQSERYPDLAGKMICRIVQPFAPRLTFTNGVDGLRQLADLQMIARTANIEPDHLFHNIPASLAVEPVEMIEAIPHGATQRPKAVKRLQIVAVCVGIGELRDNLERMLTEYFGP